jgi:para-aminobenzoate synthetase component I
MGWKAGSSLAEAVTGGLDEVVRRWPAALPLAVVSWAGEGWSFAGLPVLSMRARREASGVPRLEFVEPTTGEAQRAPLELTGDVLSDLERAVSSRGDRTEEWDRFGGGWIGYASYELGREIEPRARHAGARSEAKRGRAWPLLEFQLCTGGYLIDERAGGGGRVTRVGKPLAKLGPARDAGAAVGGVDDAGMARVQLEYQDAVARGIEYIRAGDVFQVNLAHQIDASFSGSTRSAFVKLLQRARPWYGAYMELAAGDGTRRSLVSMSPELFLDVRTEEGPGGAMRRRITTRPMKGTRPAPPLGDPEELRASEKDRAELNMIIDLMRNDLGRVCEFGTVRVTEPRAIEHHGGGRGVLQATSTVSGVLRERAGLAEVIRATFPPGSVTGAPKIRAMQIIDELERDERGVYCGAMGWIDGRSRRMSLNVAIRTAQIEGRPGPGGLDAVEDGTFSYSVGAGIVADSTPESEWEETLTKARVLEALQEGTPAGY